MVAASDEADLDYSVVLIESSACTPDFGNPGASDVDHLAAADADNVADFVP